MGISNKELEEIAKKAGLGSRSMKKLLQANDADTSTPSGPRGHGPASRPSLDFGGDF